MKNIEYSELLWRFYMIPFVFIWGIILLIVGSIFPLPLLTIISLYHLIELGMIWVTKLFGREVVISRKPYFNGINNPALAYLAGVTVYVWGVFAITVIFFQTGKLTYRYL